MRRAISVVLCLGLSIGLCGFGFGSDTRSDQGTEIKRIAQDAMQQYDLRSVIVRVTQTARTCTRARSGIR
jgi:hypothetical protein